jgi:hypothetical protein
MKKLILIFTALMLFAFMAVAQTDDTYNVSHIDQIGDYNSGYAFQKGFRNFSDIDQYMDNNDADVYQRGNDNVSVIIQKALIMG